MNMRDFVGGDKNICEHRERVIDNSWAAGKVVLHDGKVNSEDRKEIRDDTVQKRVRETRSS